MKIYISGAITNNPNYKEDFERAEDYLQREYPSAEIINPALVNSHLPKSTTHEEYMRMSFCMLDMADAIYMIRNWKTSCGASQEYGYALAKDKIILFERIYMERLTKRIGNSVVYSEFNSNNSDCCYEMMHNCLHKLAEYEDAEEQGLLLRLPCKVGTQVWKIKECSGGGRIPNWHEIYNVNFSLELLSDFGKTVFRTKEEAEQALAEKKGV